MIDPASFLEEAASLMEVKGHAVFVTLHPCDDDPSIVTESGSLPGFSAAGDTFDLVVVLLQILLAHWCIILATYPIFVDVSRIIGKLSEFEEEFTIQQLKQKIFDEWGERATLFHSIDKIIATMKAMGALKAEKPGRYTIVKHEVRDDKVNALLASTGMTVEDKGNFTLQGLREMGYMFPFQYQIERKMLMMNDTFTITNIAGEMIVSLTASL